MEITEFIKWAVPLIHPCIVLQVFESVQGKFFEVHMSLIIIIMSQATRETLKVFFCIYELTISELARKTILAVIVHSSFWVCMVFNELVSVLATASILLVEPLSYDSLGSTYILHWLLQIVEFLNVIKWVKHMYTQCVYNYVCEQFLWKLHCCLSRAMSLLFFWVYILPSFSTITNIKRFAVFFSPVIRMVLFLWR